MHNKFYTKTSWRKTTGDKGYKAQYQKRAISTLKALLKKLEKGTFSVESFGWWQEGTVDKYTFQVHVKNLEDSE